MKFSKLTLSASLFALTLPFAASADSGSAPSVQADLVRVRALAEKRVSGRDVKLSVSVYDNKDGNPCAESGINYLVDVQIRKSVAHVGPDGTSSERREWEKVNTYSITPEILHQGGDLDDSVCME